MRLLLFSTILTSLAISSPCPDSSVRVVDTSGIPVTGAVMSDTSFTFISDGQGRFLPAPPAGLTVSIRAMGYSTWTGPVPADGTIILAPRAIQSGVTIPVRARRVTATSAGIRTVEIGGGDLPGTGLAGAHSLEILSPGLAVREYGGAVSVLSISIRGSDPSQIGWSIDGHRVRSSMDGTPAIAFLDGFFDSVRLARGGGSAFSEGGLAGTIELQTPETGSPPVLFMGMDSRKGFWCGGSETIGDRLRMACSFSRPVGPGGGRGRAAGVLASFENGGFSSGTLVTSAVGDAESPDWTVLQNAEISRSSIDSWFSWAFGGISLDGGGHLGGIGYSADFPDTVRDRHGEGSVESGAVLRIEEAAWKLDLTSDLRWEWVSGTALGARRRLLTSIGAAAGSTAWGLLSTAAARVECDPSGGSRLGARAGAGVPVTGQMVIEASISSSFRRPTFNELYWPRDPFAEGNPDLLPETSTEMDLTAEYSSGGTEAAVSVFSASCGDLIIWAPSADGLWRPGNVSRVLRRGIELSGLASTGALSIRGSLTLQDIRDVTRGSTNEGRQLPYRPSLTAGCLMGADLGPATAGISATYTGSRCINAANTIVLPAYGLLGASLEMPVRFIDKLSLALSGVNLLDCEYEETNGYPGRGATVMLELRWEGDR